MKIDISKQELKDEEIEILMHEMKSFPNVGMVPKDMWRQFGNVFVITRNRSLIGVCVVILLKNWVKLGPFIIRNKFQGKGYGKILLTHVVSDLKNKNLYIGSSNSVVGNIVQKLRFRSVKSFFQLPLEIKLYLLKYLFGRLNIGFLLDYFRKRFLIRKGKYQYYIRVN